MSVSDIRRMQMLLEIHERGTIIAAADALSLTPSAVSQQIANLEKIQVQHYYNVLGGAFSSRTPVLSWSIVLVLYCAR